ncbi:MAG: orotidine-5'-phosphate decarboxylase [Myxococcota bacterium]|jgi:orotidine-5'-phosphate decarboxylase
MIGFGDRLTLAVKAVGAPIGLGLDPHLGRLPRRLQAGLEGKTGAAWRAAAADAVVDFNTAAITAAKGRVAAVKPQFAFYEQLGAAGWAALEETCRLSREAGLLIIADAKRGDISSTAAAYARAILDPTGPIAADSVTLNPWMGIDVLAPFLEYAAEGCGVFALVRTTNPGSALLQCHHDAATRLAEELERLGADHIGDSGFSPVGAVVGAQRAAEAAALRTVMPSAWFLVPGVGAQGGGAAEALAGARSDGLGSLVVSSRSLLFPASESAQFEEEPSAFIAAQIDALSARLKAVRRM